MMRSAAFALIALLLASTGFPQDLQQRDLFIYGSDPANIIGPTYGGVRPMAPPLCPIDGEVVVLLAKGPRYQAGPPALLDLPRTAALVALNPKTLQVLDSTALPAPGPGAQLVCNTAED